MTTSSAADPTPTDLVLVIAADGTVARATLDALIRRDTPVRALVRRPRTDADGAVAWLVGDLRDHGVLRNALTGVGTVLYVTPHADEEVELATSVVEECRRAGARLVFVGVHVTGRTLLGRLTGLALRMMMPAYAPKLAIGRMVEATSPEAVLLVPSNFYDNDLTFLADIEAGTFPTPLRRINRVAVCDVGEIAADALTDPDFRPGVHGISGPASLTGEQSAATWAQVLGRPVRYTGSDPTAWEAALCRRIPEGKKRRDWRNSFRYLARLGLGTSAREVAETTRLLGRPPTGYRAWVQAQVDQRTGTRAGFAEPHC